MTVMTSKSLLGAQSIFKTLVSRVWLVLVLSCTSRIFLSISSSSLLFPHQQLTVGPYVWSLYVLRASGFSWNIYMNLSQSCKTSQVTSFSKLKHVKPCKFFSKSSESVSRNSPFIFSARDVARGGESWEPRLPPLEIFLAKYMYLPQN